jgi:tetratricopeptide (TPR) repeat protein
MSESPQGRKADHATGEAFRRAVTLHRAGRVSEALAEYDSVLATRPDNPDALNLSGVALFQLGDAAGAEKRLRRAVERAPDHAEAFGNLGIVLKARGRRDEAESAYARAVAIEPSNANALFNLGIAKHDAGKFGEAETAYRKALEVRPDWAEALNNLGNVLRDAGRLEDALVVLERAAAAAPNEAQTHYNRGCVLHELKQPLEAEAALRRAIAIAPDLAEAHNSLGVLAMEAGAFDEAGAAYRKAIALDPASAYAHNNLGNLMKTWGKLDDARAAYRRAIDARPDYARAYYHLVDLDPDSLGKDDVARMESTFADMPENSGERAELGFALSRLRERGKEYDRAFEYLESANRIRRAGFDYRASDTRRIVDRMIAAFTPDVVKRADGVGFRTNVPIFVLGMPRSGTTLIEQILASHSAVFGAGERGDFKCCLHAGRAEKGREADFPDAITEYGPETWRRLGEAYVDGLRALAPRSPRITDKMPVNFLYVGFIHLALPEAKIVHCVRDPLDTCLSCFKADFVSPQHFAYDLAELGLYYRDYRRLMDHWHAVLPGRILDVGYEVMVANQERETRRLLDHCGLGWEDACLSFHATERPVLTASSAQVRKPMYRDSIDRWRRYERHLGPLVDALGPLGAQISDCTERA